jgi:ribosomal protein S18 acetylase RimI-like enzyme
VNLKSRHGLEIRTATGSDAPGLAEMLARAGHAVPARRLADRLEAIRQQSGTVLIAVDWGPPSGLIVAHWYPALHSDHPVAQITMLLVSPDDRRRGIGRLLLKAAAQAARSAGCDVLEIVADGNEPGLKAFCGASGFADAGQRFVRALRKQADRAPDF